MTFKLPVVSRFIRDENGRVARPPVQDRFLEPFDDEIIRLTLFMLANRNWTGNRFEAEIIGTPLFFRKVRNKAANGWTGLGGGMEIGRRDGKWKIIVHSFDPNRIAAERAQGFLDVGWRNINPRDEYDLAPNVDIMGRPTGLGSIPNATEMQGDRDVFSQDMMLMRLYSTEQ